MSLMSQICLISSAYKYVGLTFLIKKINIGKLLTKNLVFILL